MVHYSGSAIAWGVFVTILGVLLVVTAVANVSLIGMKRMSLFGLLMVLYGLVMLLLGALMYSGVIPLMMEKNFALVSSLGMFVVGALMLVNGSIMTRTRSSQGIKM